MFILFGDQSTTWRLQGQRVDIYFNSHLYRNQHRGLVLIKTLSIVITKAKQCDWEGILSVRNQQEQWEQCQASLNQQSEQIELPVTQQVKYQSYCVIVTQTGHEIHVI